VPLVREPLLDTGATGHGTDNHWSWSRTRRGTRARMLSARQYTNGEFGRTAAGLVQSRTSPTSMDLEVGGVRTLLGLFDAEVVDYFSEVVEGINDESRC
jgi:hypothetical protein